jgi:hypothetical protein
MSDDIETIRAFINKAILSPTDQELSDRGDALRALERVIVDRDSLRAKLEKAKDTLEFYAERMSYTARRGMECGITKDNFGDCARAVLAELSADAPAQPPQIGDEAIRRAVKKFHHYAGVDDFAAMRAALAAALNGERKG